MSFETIQKEIATWDDSKLRQLIAYAVVLQDRQNGELSPRAEESTPARWVSLDELDQRLGFGPDDLKE